MDQNKGFFNDIIGIFVVVSPYVYIFKYHRLGLSRLVMIPSFVPSYLRSMHSPCVEWVISPLAKQPHTGVLLSRLRVSGY